MTMLATEAASEVASADIAGDAAAGKAGSSSHLTRKAPATPARRQAGGAVPSARGNRSGRSGKQVVNRAHNTMSKRGGGQTRRKSKGAKLPKLASGKPGTPHTGTLIIEWLVAVMVCVWAVLDGTDDYLTAMSKALWRISALSGIFFVLALVMRGKNTGRVALAFGAIIDLALILQATSSDSLKGITGVFSGKGTGATVPDSVAEQTEHRIGNTAAQDAAQTTKDLTGKKPKKGTPGAPGTP